MVIEQFSTRRQPDGLIISVGDCAPIARTRRVTYARDGPPAVDPSQSDSPNLDAGSPADGQSDSPLVDAGWPTDGQSNIIQNLPKTMYKTNCKTPSSLCSKGRKGRPSGGEPTPPESSTPPPPANAASGRQGGCSEVYARGWSGVWLLRLHAAEAGTEGAEDPPAE